MSKKFLLGLLFLIIFFLLPSKIIAEVELPEKDSHYLLNSAQQGLINEWIKITSSASFSAPEKQAALYLIRNSIQQEELNYAFKDLPKDFAESTIKLAASFYFSPDIASVLGKMEKETTQKAVDIAMDWLLEKEIKVSSGKLSYSFTSYKGNKQKPVFYYNLAYRSLNEKEGEVVIEFYSPERIVPQKPTAAILSIKRSSWDFLSWRAKGNEEIGPFILRIKGKVSKEAMDRYSWQETVSVDVSFTDSMPPMPEIAPEEPFVAKLPIVGGYYKDLRNRIQKAEVLVNRAIGRGKDNKNIDDGKSIKDSIKDVGSRIKSYFSKINPLSASIVQSPPDQAPNSPKPPSGEMPVEEIIKIKEFIEKELDDLWEIIIESSLEEMESSNHQEQEYIPENEEEEDDLVEKINVSSQKTNTLIKIAEILEKEGDEKEKIAEIKDIIKEKEVFEEDVEEKSVENETKEEKEDVLDSEEIVKICNKSISNNPKRSRVIINELAWMGTKSSANDEWIELKNISEESVNLEGWQILDKNNQIEIIFEEESIIPPNGFLLLERTDDESVPFVKADLVYTGGLNNSNEELYLFNNDCILEDKVVADPAWPAGENSGKKSMERSEDLSWHTYHGAPKKGILGTPKSKNTFAPLNISIGPITDSSSEEPVTENSPVQESTSTLLDVIITEIQIEGEESSHDFIELYNPNTTTVDISGFQLKKKSSSGKDYSVRLFPEGSIIGARDYFLWLNSTYASSSQLLADTISSQSLAKDNSIALIDDEENIINAVAWGSSTNPFVEGEAFPGNPQNNESLARKWNENEEYYQDNDNNKEDFEIQKPSPGENSSSSKQIVDNKESKAAFSWEPQEVFTGDQVLFDAASSSSPDGELVSFIWNLGEGSTTTNKATTTYSYSSSTEYLVGLRVIDNEGVTSSLATSSLKVKEPSFLEVEPTSLELEIEEGDFLEEQSLIITNKGEENKDWVLSTDYSSTSTGDWIKFNSNTGTIELNSSSTVKFNLDNSLTPGEHSATATLDIAEEIFNIPIRITVIELPEPTLSVVINEISWAGTKADANDEWIELYNNTNEEVNLSDWKIKSGDGAPNIDLSGIIPANGYFLLERTDDQVVSDIEASQIYTGSLGNEGERLKLVNASSTLIDIVDCSDGWFGGRNRKMNDEWIRISMERVNPTVSGNDDSNWITNDGFKISGKDKEGNYIIGTPGQENSRYNFYSEEVFYGGSVSWDAIWTKKGGPYQVRSTFHILEDSIFIIEPGAKIELAVNRNSRIKVSGILMAGDKEGEQVVFTSNLESNAPRLWDYIYFTGPGSVLENVLIECGGWYHRLPPFSVKGAVTIENTDIVIRDSVFRNNLVADIWLINSSSTIENTSFEGLNKEYYYEPRGPGRGITVDIYLDNSNPILKNLTFDENEVNIYPE